MCGRGQNSRKARVERWNSFFRNNPDVHKIYEVPLTWPRQVVALVDLPDEVGVDHPDAAKLFPKDTIERAREIKRGLGGMGTGAYTHSKGARCFRDDIAQFITMRDGGVPCDPESIFMTNGASAGINMILTALIADESWCVLGGRMYVGMLGECGVFAHLPFFLNTPLSGVLIPIPQYPIYSATIDLLGGHKVGYYLDEKNGWALDMDELERSLQEAKENDINVVSFVLINPGNPTGNVLSREAVQDVCRFCAKHNLVLLADEVYQDNIYHSDAEFVSCKLAAYETGLLHDGGLELVSFHSTSKGLFGECGRRGGYMELVGFDPKVVEHIYKLASSGLCSTVNGQVMMSLMVRGPKPGDESYKSHEAEKQAVYNSLKERSRLVSEGLDSIPGFSCQSAMGAMYCFPRVSLPKGAIEAAEKQGISPDTLYAISLLEATGICVVPASGFGQEDGRYGFRTTFLPPKEEMKKAVKSIRKHYEDFCRQYGD
jgi:aspartate/methionine/tyrosine aminotransferase